MADQTARQLLEGLPDRLGISESNIRITIRLHDGRYLPPLRVTQFRIHASNVENVNCEPPANRIGVDLEAIAEQIGCVNGAAEIVAEYEHTRDGVPRFKWLDVTWEV